ncbi:MAG: hypothetical protein HN712_26585 [Gemmatimonadetes bacterium]|nr:hypothetical protein [Gemmatimonadota bacterium]MBT7863909.1 hypothetical protein [Gemmatimonadota bacterium]
MGPVLRQLDVTNLFTLTGLALALGVVIHAAHHRPITAVLCLLGCGLVDLFDGLLAKNLLRRDEARAAGPVLDSLVDACAFGLAPAALLYSYVETPIAIIVGIVYASVCILRLTYFERVGLTTSETAEHYVGLPVTYSALFIPLAFVARSFAPDTLLRPGLLGLYLLLAAAMAAGIRVPKLRGVWYVAFAVGAAALVAFHSGGALAEWGTGAQ